MNSMRVITGMLLLVMITGFACNDAAAWSNGGYSADQDNPDYGTHDWILDRALAIQTRDVGFMETTYHARLLLGTEAPDNPAFIGDIGEHHVYYRSTGEVQDDSSAARASSIYANALAYLRSGAYEEAAYCVGVMSHYISDPGVFGHTMGSATDWGAETHHSDYEDHMQSLTWTLSFPTGMMLGNSSAYDATLGLARSVTFGTGQIMPNVWMDAHYSWSNATFSASAFASLHASVGAVAAAINHLMFEANASEPAPKPLPPSPPTALTAVWEKGLGVILTWSAPQSGGTVMAYLIYRSTDPGWRGLLATVSDDVLTWTDQTATPGSIYYYWVASSDSATLSDLTLPASVTIPGHKSSVLAPIVVAGCSAMIAVVGTLLLRDRRLHRVQK